MKQKRRISSPEEHVSETSPDNDQMLINNSHEVKLHAFPTTGQPVIGSDLKEMLLTLKSAIQHDMHEFMQNSKREIDRMGERVEYIEEKMGDFTEAHNDLVDAHFELKDKIKQLKLKVADLEEGSRCNNAKFRGIQRVTRTQI